MPNTFGRAVIEDVDGTNATVQPERIPGRGHLVELAIRSGGAGYSTANLEPGAARALARALDEAADDADLRALEELA